MLVFFRSWIVTGTLTSSVNHSQTTLFYIFLGQMTFFLKKWCILTCITEKQIRPSLQRPKQRGDLILSAPTELKISTISAVYLNWKYIHDQWESDYCLTPTLQFFSYSLYHLIHDGDKSIHNNMENFKRQLDMLF